MVGYCHHPADMSGSTKDNLKEAAKGNIEPLKQQIPSVDQVKDAAQTQLHNVQQAVPTSKEEVKEVVETAAKKSFQSLRDLIAGGVGGVCAVVVGHPFDLVKVRLQTAEKGVYNGAMDVVRKTIAREGPVRGLYAGVSAPLVGVTPMCKFSIYLYMSRYNVKLTIVLPQSLSTSGPTESASSSSTNTPLWKTANTASAKSAPPVSSPPSP